MDMCKVEVKRKSTVAALCDALMQSDKRTLIESKIVIKLKEIEKKRHDLIKRKSRKNKRWTFLLLCVEKTKNDKSASLLRKPVQGCC